MDNTPLQKISKQRETSKNTEESSSLPSGRFKMIGMVLFFSSAGFLMLEVSLTRIFSVVMWYHFAFLTISVALFGFALSGFVVQLLPNLLRAGRVIKIVFSASAAMAVIIPLSFKLFSINPAQTFLTGFLKKTLEGELSVGTLLLIAALYISAVIPFFIGGLVGANLFRHFGDRASKIYFFDMTGAGFGCILAVPVLNLVGGPAALALQQY